MLSQECGEVLEDNVHGETGTTVFHMEWGVRLWAASTVKVGKRWDCECRCAGHVVSITWNDGGLSSGGTVNTVKAVRGDWLSWNDE